METVIAKLLREELSNKIKNYLIDKIDKNSYYSDDVVDDINYINCNDKKINEEIFYLIQDGYIGYSLRYSYSYGKMFCENYGISMDDYINLIEYIVENNLECNITNIDVIDENDNYENFN